MGFINFDGKLMLIPYKEYDNIPNGMKFKSINGNCFTFKKKSKGFKEENNGALSFGVEAIDVEAIR